MPRTIWQALCFVLGLWAVISIMQPLGARGAEPEDAGPGSGAQDPQLSALEQELFSEVNAFRTDHHLIPLARYANLDAVARAHCRDMIARGYFSHDTPEGWNPVHRMQRAGIGGFSLAAENVGQTNERDPGRAILEGWKNSPDHRRNLEARPFNRTGVGIARAPDGRLFYTQLYASFEDQPARP